MTETPISVAELLTDPAGVPRARAMLQRAEWAARAFARYDEAAGTWDRPPGEFTVRVGRSSADLPLQLRVRSS